MVEIHDCESLDDFWNLISPIGPIFEGPFFNYRTVYRGQSDSDWLLSPQVYREDIVKRYKPGIPVLFDDHPGQTLFEWGLLDSFIYHCDMRGLSIPNDSMEFREYFSFQNIMHMNSIENSSWPQDKVLPLMAVAQHHGIPTRLLDWSSNSVIASYFAAAGAVNAKRMEKHKRIAVFGFIFDAHRKNAEYRYIHVPGSTSPNLAAQGGSFILVNNSGRRGEDFTIDVSLETKVINNDRLVKITLPVEFAADLLKRCHQFGVSAASIFPGYDGVGKAVMEGNLAGSFSERLV